MRDKEAQTQSDGELSGIQDALDAALCSLPDKYRLPIVLHHFEGRQVAEIAGAMACSIEALQKRLIRGREMLRDHLSRQGLAYSSASLSMITPRDVSSAALPTAFAAATAKTAHLIALGQAGAAVAIPAKVSVLTKGALKMLFIEKLKTAAAIVLISCTVCGAAGVSAYKALASEKGGPEVTKEGEHPLTMTATISPGWPQWRGPTRDGVAPPQKWNWKWPEEGPTKLWSAKIGAGYSSPIIVNGRVYGFGRDSGDFVHCIDAKTGTELWKTKVGEGRDEFVTSTPCSDGTHIFCVTADGNVTALDAESGKQVWQVNIVKEYKTSRGGFHGISNSPLLYNDMLVLSQGLALNKDSGKLVWQNKEVMTGTHCSPLSCPAGSQAGLLFVAGKGILRVDPASGNVLWKQDAPNLGYMDPIVSGDQITAITGAGGYRFKFTSDSISKDDKDIFNSNIYGYFGAGDMANPIQYNGYFYVMRTGSSDRSGMFADNPDMSASCMQCFDAKTWKNMWTTYGITGTPILCDGKIIIEGQWGDLRVIEASPDGYKELANAKIFGPRDANPTNPFGRASFATPILHEGRIYCRYYLGDLICVDVSKDYPNPDQKVGQRRIIGELQTVTGTLSNKTPEMPNHVIAVLTEDKPADPSAKPAVYKLCATKHNDNPGALEKHAALITKSAHVSVTGTLLYDDQMSVNKMEEKQ
jgi:outer membrane protein assembly factor BamB